MKMRSSSFLVLAVVLLSSFTTGAEEEDLNDTLDGRRQVSTKISTSLKIGSDDARNRTDKVREVVTSAMRTTEKREQIGEVIPIIRSMSPPQKLAMGTIISKRISNNQTTSAPFEEVRSLLDTETEGNATRELMLPISMDIAKIITDDSGADEEGEEETPEELPEAQELRYVRTSGRRRPVYRPPPRRSPASFNRRNVYSDPPRASPVRPPRRPVDHKRGPSDKECTFFTKTVCLTATDYPHDAILRSLRSNKEMVAALLTDYKAQDNPGMDDKLPRPLPLENQYDNRYENAYEIQYESNEIRRRSDLTSPYENIEEGFTCPSVVKYARPQLARAASGIWKYIINIGEHTQTLRLEKCSNPKSSCSFISENYKSSCVQVYNYHRLLTWDSKLGLHMDIFKVPTCCSCHVHGYSDIFPPHQKDPPLKPKENFPGADFATSDQTDDFQDLNRPNYLNNFKPASNFDSNLGIMTENYSVPPVHPYDYGQTENFASVSSNKKPVLELGPSSRPPFTLPGRNRLKKPTVGSSPMPRPFDKLPQQHAPNTRAPGYKGPLSSRPSRPNRPPYRRESTVHAEPESTESTSNTPSGKRYNQLYDQDVDASSRLQNGGFDDEYQEPQRRINYNYHPIIDFFKPEASMLQSSNLQPSQQQQSNSAQSDSSNSWKPITP